MASATRTAITKKIFHFHKPYILSKSVQSRPGLRGEKKSDKRDLVLVGQKRKKIYQSSNTDLVRDRSWS